MGARLSSARALLRRRSVRFGLVALGLLAGLAGLAGYLPRADPEAPRRRQLADQALERQDLPAAVAHLRSYLAAVPDSADGRFLLAQTLRREGKYDEAEHELAEASRLGWDPAAV